MFLIALTLGVSIGHSDDRLRENDFIITDNPINKIFNYVYFTLDNEDEITTDLKAELATDEKKLLRDIADSIESSIKGDQEASIYKLKGLELDNPHQILYFMDKLDGIFRHRYGNAVASFGSYKYDVEKFYKRLDNESNGHVLNLSKEEKSFLEIYGLFRRKLLHTKNVNYWVDYYKFVKKNLYMFEHVSRKYTGVLAADLKNKLYSSQ